MGKKAKITKKKHVFIGKVTEVLEDSFWAYLEDITEPFQPDSIAEFEISVVPERDRKFIQEGALFAFMIRYYEDKVENYRPYSIIRFMKRYWKKEDIERAESWARVTSKFFEDINGG